MDMARAGDLAVRHEPERGRVDAPADVGAIDDRGVGAGGRHRGRSTTMRVV